MITINMDFKKLSLKFVNIGILCLYLYVSYIKFV